MRKLGELLLVFFFCFEVCSQDEEEL
ncbi:uncharacterized protein METZ01_LOCUS115375, partial [marine metagenome]